MDTPAKEWARKRNSSKFIITGAYANLQRLTSDPILNRDEQLKLREATKLIDEVTRRFSAGNVASKIRYLNPARS